MNSIHLHGKIENKIDRHLIYMNVMKSKTSGYGTYVTVYYVLSIKRHPMTCGNAKPCLSALFIVGIILLDGFETIFFNAMPYY